MIDIFYWNKSQSICLYQNNKMDGDIIDDDDQIVLNNHAPDVVSMLDSLGLFFDTLTASFNKNSTI